MKWMQALGLPALAILGIASALSTPPSFGPPLWADDVRPTDLADAAFNQKRKSSKPKDNGGSEPNADVIVGVFELVEIKSPEVFRALYLQESALYLGRDADWEYVALIGSDRVYKVSRETVDRQALQRMQAERAKIKRVPGGPPKGHQRSKEFLAWLERTKLEKDEKPAEPPQVKSQADTIKQARLAMLNSSACVIVSKENMQIVVGSAALVDDKQRLLVIGNRHLPDVNRVHLYFPMYRKEDELITDRETYLKEAKPIVGKIVSRVPKKDLALIQAESLPPKIKGLPIATSEAKDGQHMHVLACPAYSAHMFIYTPVSARAPRQGEPPGAMDGVDQLDMKFFEVTAPTHGLPSGVIVNDEGELTGISSFTYAIDASEISSLLKTQGSLDSDADFKTLVGEDETAWELAKKDNNPKLRLAFYREDEKKNGVLTIYDDAGPRVKMGLGFRFEKKDDKKIMIVDGFDKGSDPVLPYRLEEDKLVIESGKAALVTPVVKGSVQLKGEWKRVKVSSGQAK